MKHLKKNPCVIVIFRLKATALSLFLHLLQGHLRPQHNFLVFKMQELLLLNTARANVAASNSIFIPYQDAFSLCPSWHIEPMLLVMVIKVALARSSLLTASRFSLLIMFPKL